MFNVPSGTIAGGGKAVCFVFISKDVRLANIRVFSLDGAFSGVGLVDATMFHFQRRSWSSSARTAAEVRAGGDRRTAHTHMHAHAETLVVNKEMEHTPLAFQQEGEKVRTFRIKHLSAASRDCAASNMNDT